MTDWANAESTTKLPELLPEARAAGGHRSTKVIPATRRISTGMATASPASREKTLWTNHVARLAARFVQRIASFVMRLSTGRMTF